MARLMGDKIMLREYESRDIQYVYEWVNDPAVIGTLGDIFIYPRSEEQCIKWVNSCMEGFDERTLHYVIADKATGEFMGQIDLMKIDWKNRSAVMGIVLNGRSLGKGHGTDSIRTLLRFAFEQMGLHRVQLDVYSTNERGKACYKKCGFKEIGRRRDAVYRDGAYNDLIAMDILEGELI